MLHTNLRELVVCEEIFPELNREEGTLGPSTSDVLLEKGLDTIVYLIGPEGENIISARHGKQVALPLPFYGGDAKHVESAVCDRLAALLEALVSKGCSEKEYPVVGLEKVLPHMDEVLAPRRVKALLANTSLATLLEAVVPPEVKVYAYDSFEETTVIGLADPKYVGRLIVDPRVRDDDPDRQTLACEPTSPGSISPPISLDSILSVRRLHAGMIVHGGAAAATVKL